jgi:hypothetical protein
VVAESYRQDEPVPAGTADPLLWRLAAAVAAAHQPDQQGRCTNLQCHGQRGACWAGRMARRALRLARTGPQPAAPAPLAPPHQPAAVPREGTAPPVARPRQPFVGWFATHTPGWPAALGDARMPARAVAAA